MTEAAMSITTFGRRIAVSRTSAYRIVAEGKVDTINVGTGKTPRLRITEAALAEYLRRAATSRRAAA